MELSKCLGCMEDFRGYPCPGCGYDPKTTKNAEYALTPGTILAGKYLVGKVLGQGGFGITYIGWDIPLERKVAVKEYYPSGQVSRSPGTRNLTWYTTEAAEQARRDGMQMFLKEARKMSRADGIPGVVRVLDLFQENGTAYIVMEFIEGVTLKAKLQQTGPLPWEQVRELFLSVIQTMAQVHKAGLVHRDLSPDNIMLLPNGGVKILDLGAAKDLSINSGASSMQVAKSGFSPLEQYTQRGGSGPWTDVYSMAATIYYTLTGKLPPNAIDRMDKDTLSWENAALLALPPQALKALQKAMAVQAQNRTQSMDVLGQGLMGKKQSSQPQTVPGGQNSGKKPDNSAAEVNRTGEKAKKKRKWIVPVAAACIVACLAVTPLLLRKGTSAPNQSGTAQTSRNAPAQSGVSPTPAQSGISSARSNFNTDCADFARRSGWTEHVSKLQDKGTQRTYRDEQGRERCCIYEFDRTSRIVTYDGEGDITEERSYDEDGIISSLRVYSYDEGGNQTGSVSTCYYEDYYSTIEYDADSNPVSWYTYNNDGSVRNRAEYEYDKMRHTRTVSRYSGDGKLEGREEYDDQGNELWSKGYDEDGKLRYEYTYTYDSMGVLTGITITNYYSWNNTKTVTEYDGNCNQISKKEYDANGNLISSK